MAYQTGGYGASHMQRPYAGQGAPSAHVGRPPRAPMQPYGDYQARRGFNDQGAGYRPSRDEQFQDSGRAPGPPPPRDYSAVGARGPGAPILGPNTTDGRRGGQQPPRGNYMPNGTSTGRRMAGPMRGDLLAAQYQAPNNNGPPGHADPGYGGHGDLASHMAGMAISGQQDRDYLAHGYGAASQTLLDTLQTGLVLLGEV
ncbi:hypothetical protein CDD81_5052 [Ophiocordyceps australis]|uniref:Uncharacterized protein n=1 Tax=Ophiocordyceps australis TaxID=1399860 RepID=A0A2C5XA70_9HYPO|nr:hypothetical protein CDD81_5052 [Ophiocordyceps australis]